MLGLYLQFHDQINAFLVLVNVHQLDDILVLQSVCVNNNKISIARGGSGMRCNGNVITRLVGARVNYIRGRDYINRDETRREETGRD